MTHLGDAGALVRVELMQLIEVSLPLRAIGRLFLKCKIYSLNNAQSCSYFLWVSSGHYLLSVPQVFPPCF